MLPIYANHNRNRTARSTVMMFFALCLVAGLWPALGMGAGKAHAADAPYLMSLNRPVYVSSNNGSASGHLAVDGDTNTRWESKFGVDPQWLYVDLGASASITRVVIQWESAYAKSFRIETSNDEYSWTPIYTNTNFGGGTTDVNVSGTGRYVRVFSAERALTAYGVSLYELQVYGTGGINTPPKPEAPNVALHKPASSSSEEHADYLQPKDYATANVTDGDRNTRWSSPHDDPQWVAVDLGQNTLIGKVVIRWETAFGRAYDIQTSADGSHWTTVFRQLHGSGGVDEIPLYANGRYVRMYGIGRGSGYGYSLYELEVYPYQNGDPQPTYAIADIPPASKVNVGSGSYEINDITQLEAVYPKYKTSNISGPIPSNDWWQNLLINRLGNGTGIVTLPLKNSYTTNGLGLMNPGIGYVNGDGGAINADGEPDLFLMSGSMTNTKAIETKVDGYGDYSVNVIMSDDSTPKMKTTFVKGSPYVYNTFSDPNSVEIYSSVLTRLFDDNGNEILANDGGSLTADHIGIQVTNVDNAATPHTFVRNYGVFAPPGTVFTRAGSKIKIKLGGGQNYMSVAALPSAGDLNYFYQHGYAFVTDTKVAYNYDVSQATVTTNFNSITQLKRSGFSADTLMAMLPHQWKVSNSSVTSRAFPSIRGTLKVHEGNMFTTADQFTGIIPQMVEPSDSSYSRTALESYLGLLDTELANPDGLMILDPYWQGKVLHPAAMAALISDQLGDQTRRDKYLKVLRDVLVDWYTYSPGEEDKHSYYFHYSPEWGSIFPWASGFGVNTGLTDHHYTYGYYSYASAVLAAFDPAFKQQYGAMVEVLIRDYANPSRTDSMFPWMRSFDPYEGHSWAGGYADNNSGNNQEAAGESLDGWSGAYLWGVVTGNNAIRDAAVWGFTTELKAIEQYWFNFDHDNWNPEYKHGIAGQVYGSAYLYGTYFSGAPVNIYGIHWLPTAEWMTYFGKYPDKAAELYQAFLKDNGGPEQGWEHIVWPFQALSDPAAVIGKWNPAVMQQNEVFNAYWFIHNAASYGNRTTDVWADNWSSAGIYKKGNQYTAQVWNPTSAPIQVQFRNASGVTGSATVAAHSLVKVDPMTNNGEVSQPGGGNGGNEGNGGTGGGAYTALDHTGWTASSEPTSGDAAANMLDGNLATRWSSGSAMAAGQSVTLDMKAAKTFSRIVLDANGSGDYARGYEVYVSNDGANWGTAAAAGTGSTPAITIDFAAQNARYVKIVQTGTSSSWWSIHELNVYSGGSGTGGNGGSGGTSGAAMDRAGWMAASNPTSGDAASNLLDGNASSRWSAGQPMASGQYVQVDMGAVKSFNKLVMDSTGSDNDYARGYEVYVSGDGTSWGSAIASGSGSGAIVTATFPTQNARYIRIVQTGTSASWWSIYELNVFQP